MDESRAELEQTHRRLADGPQPPPGPAPPGGWAEEQLVLGERRFSLTRPANPELVLEQFAGAGDPYWAQLWPASVSLAEAILRAPELAAGGSARGPRHAVELGCGGGLAGLALATLGWRVTFTDYSRAAIDLALHNARRNGVRAASARLLDWRTADVVRCDFALAADVVYDRTLHQPLLDTLARSLPAGGVCWIGEPGRSSAEEFLGRAAEQRWRIALYDEAGRPLSAPRFNCFTRIVLQRPE